MKAAFITAALLSAASAQVTYDPTTNKFTCAVPNGVYCASDSLTSNIIIRCSAGVGQPGNCNDNLAGVPPVGVKTSALCYQSTPTAADGACSFNGVAYPDGKPSFTIGAGSNSTTASSVVSVPSGTNPGGPVVTVTSPCTTSTLSTVTGTGVVPPPGTNPGSTGTGTGGSGPQSTGTWSATATPTPTVFPGAGSIVSANWALLPAAGLVAALL